MWSQHGFWNNLDPISGPGGGGGYQHPGGYPGYQDQELSSFYKQHYGYDPAAVFGQKQDSESPSRGKKLRFFSVLNPALAPPFQCRHLFKTGTGTQMS